MRNILLPLLPQLLQQLIAAPLTLVLLLPLLLLLLLYYYFTIIRITHTTSSSGIFQHVDDHNTIKNHHHHHAIDNTLTLSSESTHTFTSKRRRRRISLSIGLPPVLEFNNKNNGTYSCQEEKNCDLVVYILLSVPRSIDLRIDPITTRQEPEMEDSHSQSSELFFSQRMICEEMSSALVSFILNNHQDTGDVYDNKHRKNRWLLEDDMNICNVVGFGPSMLPHTNVLVTDAGINMGGDGIQNQHDWQHYHLLLIPNHFTSITSKHDEWDLGRILLNSLWKRRKTREMRKAAMHSGGAKLIEKWCKSLSLLENIDSDQGRILSKVANTGYISVQMGQHIENGRIDGSKQWLVNKLTHTSSPFSLSKLLDYDSSSNESRSRYATASLSALDPSSQGLHRRLDHKIFVEYPATDYISRVQLVMLLPIDNGLFIDLDEPFSEDSGVCSLGIELKSNQSTTCKVKVLDPPRVIDIEQPAFVSPQSMLGISISADLGDDFYGIQAGEIKFVSLSFSTNIHFRYPMPVSRYSSNINYEGIPIPLPQLEFVNGFAINSENDIHKISQTRSISISLQNRLYNDYSFNSLRPTTFTYVNAGCWDDYALVQVVTLLVGFYGTITMAKSISEKSLWT